MDKLVIEIPQEDCLEFNDGTKSFIDRKHINKLVQEHAFKLGCAWNGGDKAIRHTYAKYLYFTGYEITWDETLDLSGSYKIIPWKEFLKLQLKCDTDTPPDSRKARAFEILKSLASNSKHTANNRTRYELVKMSFEMVDEFDKYADAEVR